MSSRALRKLQGTSDIVVPGLQGDGSSDDEPDVSPVRLQKNTKKNKKRKDTAPGSVVNPFDLLNEDEGDSPVEEGQGEPANGEAEGVETESAPPETTAKAKKKKKKKKKKNRPIEENKPANHTTALEDEDEIDAGLREVNELLGELPVNNSANSSSSGITVDMRALLAVEHKNLNPENEMRRIFGSRVVQAEQRVFNRRRGRVVHRTTWLTRPRDNWPNMGKSGLTMSLVDSSSGQQVFTFEHNAQYQQAQFEFLDAVESLNPQNIVAVLNAHPYHIDSLLQLSEVCRMSEDTQMATELIERALFVFECNFHPLYNISSGNCRLDYRRQENRAMFIALFRHILFVGQRGCYRTALELCKVLLSLSPDGDPLCVLLMIDFYALKSEQFDFLFRLFQEWEVYRNLSQLPNFAYSVPLALFHLSRTDNAELTQADTSLQTALLMFPGVLLSLLDHCNVAPDPQVAAHQYFSASAQFNQPEALNQLVALYVGRCFPCWKEPEVVAWLERNVKEVVRLVDSGDPRVKDFAEKRKQRYHGTPRNIYRHILLAEIKDATAALPPELSSSPVLSYDPLPPKDAITSYSRPPRQRVVDQDSSALSMFFRSLLPNFNPEEVVDEPAAGGAAGGQDLRQGIGALMDAMRDLLNNIQPVPAPREDGQDVHGDQQFDDQLDEFD